MQDAILRAVEEFVGSPWVYVALLAVAKLDAFFPVVPSETVVITLGVFAAAGTGPHIVLVILFAALGAFAGDHISYFIGRKAGPGLMARAKPGSRTQRSYDSVGRMLAKRGGLVLITARYIPGGRTAATLTTGATRYPLRRFSCYDAIAALSWATYSGLIGYLGGAAFENDPLRALLMGLALAVVILIVHEAVRLGYERRTGVRARRAAADANSDANSDADTEAGARPEA